MYKKILLSLSLLAGQVCFGADTAGDYFHRGAQFYIWGKKQDAKNEVITGLKLFPQDAQLNGLAGLLKKEEEQQQQQQQQQNQQQQQDQSKQDQNQQQQQSQENQQKNDSSQQNQQQQQQQAQQKPKPDQQKQQQQAAQQAEESKNEGDKKDQEEAYAAGKMTPEQAKQLLDSQKGDEMMLPIKPEGKPTDRQRPIKDW